MNRRAMQGFCPTYDYDFNNSDEVNTMNITFGRHSIFSRQGVARFACAILIAAFCLGGSAANAAEESVKTRFGTLRLQQTDSDYSCQANLLFNGKSIWKGECSSFGISLSDQVFSLPDHDIVIISHYNKGSAGGGSFTAVVLDQKKTPKLLKHKDFGYSGDSWGEKPKIVGNHLEIDLGFKEKLRTIVKIEGESLTVSYEKPVSIPPLTQDECSWLYSTAFRECSAHPGDCIFKHSSYQDILDNHSGVVGRGLVELNNQPAFDLEKFYKLCSAACKQHKLPDEKTFRRQICPNTKFN